MRTDSATYHGVTLQHDTVGVQESVERARSACKRIDLLRAAGFHRKSLSSFLLIDICRTYVYLLADYAMHLVPTSGSTGHGYRELVEVLNELDHLVTEYALGCIQKELYCNDWRARGYESGGGHGVHVGGRAHCSITTAARAEITNRTAVYGAHVGECAHV